MGWFASTTRCRSAERSGAAGNAGSQRILRTSGMIGKGRADIVPAHQFKRDGERCIDEQARTIAATRTALVGQLDRRIANLEFVTGTQVDALHAASLRQGRKPFKCMI